MLLPLRFTVITVVDIASAAANVAVTMDFFLTNSSFTGLPQWPPTRQLLIGRITFQTYQHCGFDGETEWETD